MFAIRTSLPLIALNFALFAGCGGTTTSTDAGIVSHDAAVAGNGNGDGAVVASASALTGTLGTLGAAQPTVSSLVISNSGETLIYLSSAPLTCTQLQQSRWLSAAAKGSQVVEIIVAGIPKVGDYQVPPSEVNFAAGGKSSSYETAADSGKITFNEANAMGVVAGTVSATYADGSAISGTFHADFCANGQGY